MAALFVQRFVRGLAGSSYPPIIQIELQNTDCPCRGCAALKDAFHNNLDIHAITASRVFGVPQENIDASLRRPKAINFGIIYGISAFGLGRQLDFQ